MNDVRYKSQLHQGKKTGDESTESSINSGLKSLVILLQNSGWNGKIDALVYEIRIF